MWLVLAYLNWQFTYFVAHRPTASSIAPVCSPSTASRSRSLASTTSTSTRGSVDRLVGAGTFEIESAGQDGESRFSHVRHPDGVQQEIYRQMEVHARSAPAAAASAVAATGRQPAAPAANIPEQLQQLAELRDSGVISDAEFEAKKAQLLERM